LEQLEETNDWLGTRCAGAVAVAEVTMDILLSLLLFTGFIFVIMQLVREHGEHKELVTASGHLPEGVDPVCGMKVASGEGFLVAHGGVEYRFCSLACVEHFERGAPTHGQHAA
jgi:YHS domain-containing protein